jgi:hypothetical protein
LRSWYQVARQARWQRFLDVRASYGNADQVGKFTVFNIARNKYRMITVIHFIPVGSMYDDFSRTPSTTVERGKTINVVAVAPVLTQGKGIVCH